VLRIVKCRVRDAHGSDAAAACQACEDEARAP
jgi:hypothetical protein